MAQEPTTASGDAVPPIHEKQDAHWPPPVTASETADMKWPPPAISGLVEGLRCHRFYWMLAWIFPTLFGGAGAAAGAVALVVGCIPKFVIGTDDLSASALILLIAAAVGGTVGLACGLIAWYVVRAFVLWLWRTG